MYVCSEYAHVQQSSNTVALLAYVCSLVMTSAAISPSAVAVFHLASFVITQMWGSVLHGQLTQSFH